MMRSMGPVRWRKWTCEESEEEGGEEKDKRLVVSQEYVESPRMK